MDVRSRSDFRVPSDLFTHLILRVKVTTCQCCGQYCPHNKSNSSTYLKLIPEAYRVTRARYRTYDPGNEVIVLVPFPVRLNYVNRAEATTLYQQDFV